MDIILLLTIITAYAIGAIPTGYLIAQIKGIADIRAHGSGNIGATNVSRLLGIRYFFLIFLLDAGKAFLFIYMISSYFSAFYLYIFAIALLFGNGYSLFLRGSGGKGVATLCGLLAALNIHVTGLLLCSWLLLLITTQTIGIASAGTALCLPLLAYSTYNMPFFFFCLFCSFWIIKSHRSNLAIYWKTHYINN